MKALENKEEQENIDFVKDLAGALTGEIKNDQSEESKQWETSFGTNTGGNRDE